MSSTPTDYAVPPAPRTTLAIAGTRARFPVRRVYCIGRNYAAHAVEMGHDPDREAPFFFQKNPDNLDQSGRFPYPPQSNDVHHEAELAIALKSGGSDISTDSALDHVFGYAAALDMTRRDLQGEQKKAGRPWEIGKAFEHSAPIGAVHAVDRIGHPDRGRITLTIDGEVRQDGDLDQMIWKVPEMIAVLSRFFTLAAGDIILTGTPAGVGPVVRGDVMELCIDGFDPLRVDVT